MLMTIKKYFSLFLLATVLLGHQPYALAADKPSEDSAIDDSLRDISIVLGAGAVGAVLGLSTLSFVNSPSKHLKNIAVGGAIGIVIGVGVVIFSQATRTTSIVGFDEIPMNEEKFKTLTRLEFKDVKIVKDSFKEPTLGYTFEF